MKHAAGRTGLQVFDMRTREPIALERRRHPSGVERGEIEKCVRAAFSADGSRLAAVGSRGHFTVRKFGP